LVLAQNEHYWRVSDIANQKARKENLVYGSRIALDVVHHWGEGGSSTRKEVVSEYRNEKKENELREESDNASEVVGWVKANQADER